MSPRLNPSVVALGTASLLNDVSSEMIFPLLPVFLTTALGIQPVLLGFIEGTADSASSLLRPIFGALSDRWRRRKPLVIAGYAVANFSRPLLALVSAPWQVIVIRVADRIGKGVRTAPRDALLAEVSNSFDRGRAFGFHRAMDHLGAVVGPLVAAALFVALGRNYRLLFALASIPGLLAVLFTALRVREAADVPGRDGNSDPIDGRNGSGLFSSLARENASFVGLVLAVFLFALGNSSDAFLLLRLGQAGVDAACLPFLWSALHLVKVASVYPCGVLSDRIGRRPMILAGWTYYALLYAGFAWVEAPLPLATMFVAYGLFYGLTEGAERALVGDLAGPEQRGVAFGIYNAATGIGALPASILMGFLWQSASPSAAFLFGAGMAALAAAVLLFTRPAVAGANDNRSTPYDSETTTVPRA